MGKSRGRSERTTCSDRHGAFSGIGAVSRLLQTLGADVSADFQSPGIRKSRASVEKGRAVGC
jgi:hypothetical protein